MEREQKAGPAPGLVLDTSQDGTSELSPSAWTWAPDQLQQPQTRWGGPAALTLEGHFLSTTGGLVPQSLCQKTAAALIFSLFSFLG